MSGKVKRTSIYNTAIRKSELIGIEGNSNRKGRPKLTLDEIVRKDTTVCGLTNHIFVDRAEWRNKIVQSDCGFI